MVISFIWRAWLHIFCPYHRHTLLSLAKKIETFLGVRRVEVLTTALRVIADV